MTVMYLDVGQGDAAVISFPDGAHYLIDGGNTWKSSDAGERHVVPYLKWAGIDRLDGIFLSHPNRDHYGGLASVMTAIDVDTLYESMDSRRFISENEYMYVLSDLSVPRRLIDRGDVISSGTEKWKIYVLSPYIEDQNTVEYDEANDYSMVLLVVYGSTKFLFTGDIGSKTERLLVDRYGDLLNGAVLKVAHHGSKYSSSTEFIQTVNPKYSIISVGRFNTYGYPTEEALARLESVQSNIFRTDTDGGIRVVSNGSTVEVIR